MLIKEDVSELEEMVSISSGLSQEKIDKLKTALDAFPDTEDGDSDEESTIESADEFVEIGE